MKKILAIIGILAVSLQAVAQQSKEALGCVDRDLAVQAEELKASFKKQGLTIYRDAMFTMESMSPMPVGIQMVKGRMYQMIFIANGRAAHANLEIFDGNDKKIVSKRTEKGGTNYIVYSFIPDKTDLYLVVLSQKFKGKTTCGSFTLLHDAPETAPADNTVPAKK